MNSNPVHTNGTVSTNGSRVRRSSRRIRKMHIGTNSEHQVASMAQVKYMLKSSTRIHCSTNQKNANAPAHAARKIRRGRALLRTKQSIGIRATQANQPETNGRIVK